VRPRPREETPHPAPADPAPRTPPALGAPEDAGAIADDLLRHEARLVARTRRMRWLLRRLPTRSNVARYPFLRRFAAVARARPHLWSFRRSSVLPSLYVGSVLAMLPLYGAQLPLALGAALLFRGNLTVMVALQFITNPLTIGPIYLANYVVGAQMLALLGLRAGDGTLGVHHKIVATFLGGAALGLGVAVLADLAWRVAAWEVRAFRRRLRELRARGRRGGP
jgi:uncharacterized protein (DUF2062 family)